MKYHEKEGLFWAHKHMAQVYNIQPRVSCKVLNGTAIILKYPPQDQTFRSVSVHPERRAQALGASPAPTAFNSIYALISTSITWRIGCGAWIQSHEPQKSISLLSRCQKDFHVDSTGISREDPLLSILVIGIW